MNWIDVKNRVPCARESVLCWGNRYIAGVRLGKPSFLGLSEFNIRKNRSSFDIECFSPLAFCRVTHWAEIVGPAETE